MAKYTCIFENDCCVDRYDRLRAIPSSILDTLCRLICNLAIQEKKPPGVVHLMDAGAGTGRFALPLAKAAVQIGIPFELIAIDLSSRMLAQLRKLWLRRFDESGLILVLADLQEPLPIKSHSVHVAYTVATFHILERWREALENLAEILVPGGAIVLIRENNQFMHETEGFEKDADFPVLDENLRAFMQFYHAQRLLADEPYQPSELRYSDMTSAVRYLRELGFIEMKVSIPDTSFEWQKPHTFADILHCFHYRQMTTWGSELSAPARKRISRALNEWVLQHKIDSSREFYLPAKLIPHIFCK